MLPKNSLFLRKLMKTEYKALDEHFMGIFVSDKTGLLLTGELASGKEYKGSNIAGRDYFQEAKRSKERVVGDMIRSKSTGNLIYVACAPVISSSGDFFGVFGMLVKASLIAEVVSGDKHGETGYAFMINKKGIVNSHPKEELLLELDLKSLAGMEEISRAMLAGDAGVKEYVFKDVPKIAEYAPVVKLYCYELAVRMLGIEVNDSVPDSGYLIMNLCAYDSATYIRISSFTDIALFVIGIFTNTAGDYCNYRVVSGTAN